MRTLSGPSRAGASSLPAACVRTRAGPSRCSVGSYKRLYAISPPTSAKDNGTEHTPSTESAAELQQRVPEAGAHELNTSKAERLGDAVSNASAARGTISSIQHSGRTGPCLAISAQQLLQYVEDKDWHSRVELDIARRALAAYIVQQANQQELEHSARSASLKPELFRVSTQVAEQVMSSALQQQLPGCTCPWKSAAEALADEPYLVCLHEEDVVQLQVQAMALNAVFFPTRRGSGGGWASNGGSGVGAASVISTVGGASSNHASSSSSSMTISGSNTGSTAAEGGSARCNSTAVDGISTASSGSTGSSTGDIAAFDSSSTGNTTISVDGSTMGSLLPGNDASDASQASGNDSGCDGSHKASHQQQEQQHSEGGKDTNAESAQIPQQQQRCQQPSSHGKEVVIPTEEDPAHAACDAQVQLLTPDRVCESGLHSDVAGCETSLSATAEHVGAAPEGQPISSAAERMADAAQAACDEPSATSITLPAGQPTAIPASADECHPAVDKEVRGPSADVRIEVDAAMPGADVSSAAAGVKAELTPIPTAVDSQVSGAGIDPVTGAATGQALEAQQQGGEKGQQQSEEETGAQQPQHQHREREEQQALQQLASQQQEESEDEGEGEQQQQDQQAAEGEGEGQHQQYQDQPQVAGDEEQQQQGEGGEQGDGQQQPQHQHREREEQQALQQLASQEESVDEGAGGQQQQQQRSVETAEEDMPPPEHQDAYKRLLEFIRQKVWHDSDKRLDVVRKQLARYIFMNSQLHPMWRLLGRGAPVYTMNGREASDYAVKVFKQEFRGQPPWTSLKTLVQGDRYLSVEPPGRMRLHADLLMEDMREQEEGQRRWAAARAAAQSAAQSAAAAAAAAADAVLDSTTGAPVTAQQGAPVTVVDATGATSQQQQRSVQQQQASDPMSKAQSAGTPLSIRDLLQCVATVNWHTSDVQVQKMKQWLATEIILDANHELPHGPVCTDPQRYQVTAADAGVHMLAAASPPWPEQRMWDDMQTFFQHDRYFSTFHETPSRLMVQLDITRMLQDRQQQQQVVPAGTGVTKRQLVDHVHRVTWHADNAQLSSVLKAVALALVENANSTRAASDQASLDAGLYRMNAAEAGSIMKKAWMYAGSGSRPWNGVRQAVTGCKYLRAQMTGLSELSVFLDIAQLINDMQQTPADVTDETICSTDATGLAAAATDQGGSSTAAGDAHHHQQQQRAEEGGDRLPSCRVSYRQLRKHISSIDWNTADPALAAALAAVATAIIDEVESSRLLRQKRHTNVTNDDISCYCIRPAKASIILAQRYPSKLAGCTPKAAAKLLLQSPWFERSTTTDMICLKARALVRQVLAARSAGQVADETATEGRSPAAEASAGRTATEPSAAAQQQHGLRASNNGSSSGTVSGSRMASVVSVSVSVKQLLLYVAGCVWDDVSRERDAARRAVALHLVFRANAHHSSCTDPAEQHAAAYTDKLDALGSLLTVVVPARNSRVRDCFNQHPLFTVNYGESSSQASLQLNIDTLLPAAAGAGVARPQARVDTSAPVPSDITYGQLLWYVVFKPWSAADDAVDKARRAAAAMMVIKGNAHQKLNEPATTDASRYQTTLALAGPSLVLAAGAWTWARISDMFAGNQFLSVSKEENKTMHLDITKLLAAAVKVITFETRPLQTPPAAAADVAERSQLMEHARPEPAAHVHQHTQAGAAAAVMPLAAELQLLASVTSADCAAAPTNIITEQEQLEGSGALRSMLQHITAAKLVAMDLEFGASRSRTAVGSSSSSSMLSTDEEDGDASEGISIISSMYSSCLGGAAMPKKQNLHQQQITTDNCQAALLQFFVPAVTAAAATGDAASNTGSSHNNSSNPHSSEGHSSDTNDAAAGATPPTNSSMQSWDSAIYLVEVPHDTSAAQRLMNQLKSVLESSQLIKVMHDARQDSCVLHRQFDIRLTAVLDTQLLAGLCNLPVASRTNEGSGSSSSRSSKDYVHRTKGVLLHRMFGYPHPAKFILNSSSRLWFRRPLPALAVVYAADDVRYLLPLAKDLLQLIPRSVVALSDLQMMLAQHGSDALRFDRSLLPGYTPLLLPVGAAGQDPSLQVGRFRHADIDLRHSLSAGSHEAVLGTSFELKLQQIAAAGGLYQTQYVVALNEQHAAGVEVTAASAEALAAVPITAVDDAADSLKQLFPDSVVTHLEPYLCNRQPGQPYIVQVMVDAGAQVRLRLSDESVVELPCSLDIPEALQHLTAAAGSTAVGLTTDTKTSSSDQCQVVPPFLEGSSPSSSTRIPGSLHHITALRDLEGSVFGLTYFIGRHLSGAALLLGDILSNMKAASRLRRQYGGLHSTRDDSTAAPPQSLLVSGALGSGRTTLLRDIARLMSSSTAAGGLGMDVVCINTNNQLAVCAGRHKGLGGARVVPVAQPDYQAQVMLDVLTAQRPQAILVEQLQGTPQELAAASSIIDRGVLLIAGVSSSSMASLSSNQQLRPLIDALAGADELQAPAATVVAELQGFNRLRLYLDGEASLQALVQATSNGSSSSSGSLQRTTALIDSQQRVRDPATNRVLLQFSTPDAARQALDAAAAAAQAAQLLGTTFRPSLDSSSNGNEQQSDGALGSQQSLPRAFAGGWLVDLLHAAVHKSIATAAAAS